MSKTIINPSSLAKPSGYSNGILAEGRLLYLAGQTGMDTTGRIAAPGDLVAQFAQALANLKAVVTEAGGAMTDVVKLNIYVTDKGLITHELLAHRQARQSSDSGS